MEKTTLETSAIDRKNLYKMGCHGGTQAVPTGAFAEIEFSDGDEQKAMDLTMIRRVLPQD